MSSVTRGSLSKRHRHTERHGRTIKTPEVPGFGLRRSPLSILRRRLGAWEMDGEGRCACCSFAITIGTLGMFGLTPHSGTIPPETSKANYGPSVLASVVSNEDRQGRLEGLID